MNIKLDIEEGVRQPLIDFFKLRREEVGENLRKLESELHSINATLFQLESHQDLKPSNVLISPDLNGYQKSWPWIQKAKYIILKAGSPITTTEIADTIIKNEPELNRAKVVGNISAIVTSKSGQKYFTRSKNISNQNVFGVKQ